MPTTEELQAHRDRIAARKVYWGIEDVTPPKPLTKREWMNDYKRKRGCLLCETKDSVVLDFHHKDSREKDADISRLAGRGNNLTRLKTEIAKCIVLCSNCHRRVHRGLLTQQEKKKLRRVGVLLSQNRNGDQVTSFCKPEVTKRKKHTDFWYTCLHHPIQWENEEPIVRRQEVP